jgi:ATP/maltotriose-dependent transcriptional regulator MalT
VLAPTSDALTFGPGLIQEAVYQAVPETVRLALHRQIGGLLLHRDGSAVAAAAHLFRGARRGDSHALAGLERAAQELLPTAPESAADLATRALELTGPTDEQRFSRTVTAVRALVAAGRLSEAAGLAEAALNTGGSPAVVAADLRLALSSILLMTGRPDQAVSETNAILGQADLPGELYGGAEQTRLLALTAQDDQQGARRASEAILGGGAHPGDDSALGAALTALARSALNDGRVADAIGLLSAAIRRDDRHYGTSRTYPRFALASVLTALGEFDRAAGLIEEGRRQIDAATDTAWAAVPAIYRSGLHLAAGSLDAALVEAESGLAAIDEHGTLLFAPLALSVLASIALLRGDLPGAGRLIQRSRSQRCHTRPSISLWIEARLAEAQEGAARTFEMLSGVYADLPANQRLLVDQPAAAAWLVRIALSAGERSEAIAVVACAKQLAAANPGLAQLAASAVHARGLLEGQAATLQQAAADHLHPWARAAATEDAGKVLTGSDPGVARIELELALESYEKIGATRETDRVRARLRDIGVRNGHWNRVHRPVSGWDSLTDTERRVADLVSEALTNPQIAERMYLSRHTIDFHLRQIYRKLNIGSRIELARLVLEPIGA